MVSKRLKAAGVARLAGVSRAAVSRWFHDPSEWVNVESLTLKRLALSLNLEPAFFLRKSPDLTPLQTQFLWDALYPDMDRFVRAINAHEPPALARLVQVLGFHQASRIAGQTLINKFHDYKHFIKPVRRRHLELLWPLYSAGH